ncbi:shikimate 5-dehydrogenase [Xenococcus sp. PCC 7305]|uniref:shikimate dehydrogenase n=1 Tax=Xenococcus sp. PCC 7305 TaxID=102125 RepID=UPI0002ACC575|nr:shikimate dehydrogenase [Xenococcus sp. PCC 7305]ELS04881.1 shikimate 5-dehydrogenase [Xenococcus sp. PCC 7305]
MKLITGKTKLLGIIGSPVEHSLSPVMQNAAIAELGVDYIYVPFPVEKINLKQAIMGFEVIGVQGFNITIPHKQSIMTLLSEVTSTAKMVGAVNTVWYNGAGWKGTNTDVEGFVAPLKEMARDWSQTTAIVLGNGGAARAVVVGLAELGFGSVHIIGRDRQKLVNFYQTWQNMPKITKLLKVHYPETLPELLPTADLLVNTTPVGMYPHIDASPVSAELIEQLKPDAIAYDLIYTPSPTKFLRFASDRGLKAIDGLEMLVQQGAAALEIWLQQPVPINTMRNSLKKQLFG